MERKFAEILVRVAHLSEILKTLVVELDKIYETLGDTELFEILKITDRK